MRRAEVRMFGIPAGELVETDEGYIFTYFADYLTRPHAKALSGLLPLRAESYQDKRLFPFFDGLIPEGWLLDIAEKTWKLNPRDRMGLLLACCHDCIGAAAVFPIPEKSP